MTRQEFLAHIGDPRETRARADALMQQARAAWEGAGGAWSEIGGARKVARNPSLALVHAGREFDRLRAEAQALRGLAHDQECEWNAPAHCQRSHTHPRALRRWGLDGLADRTEALEAEHFRRAEALEP